MPVPTDVAPSEQTTESSVDAFPALEHFRVSDIPPAAYYIPDFITEEEEEYLLRKLQESPQPKWKTVGTGRRLQYWGGTMSKGGVLLPEPLPDFLTTFPDLVHRLDTLLAKGTGKDVGLDINQVLVNEYQPGQGISPHEDGPAFRPLVATISLGSHTVLDIHHYISATSPSPPMTASLAPDNPNEPRPIAAVPLAHLLLLPRSLLVLSSTLYASHLHAITARTEDVVQSSTAAPGENHGDGDAGGVTVANEALLGNAAVVDTLWETGSWSKARGVRTSLTFRHAERVVKGGAFGKALGALKKT
ncbi:hypothetical protein IAT38_006257 [Cryptococcus sp. DSM 104549]